MSALSASTSPTPVSRGLQGSSSKFSNGNGKRRRHSRFRNGCRVAALRGYTGAKLVIDQGVDPVEAAVMTGSCEVYVRALVVIIKSGDTTLLNEVLSGRVPVVAAATQVRGLAKLLQMFATVSTKTKAEFGAKVGIDHLFDSAIAPNLGLVPNFDSAKATK
jgi:hypothetical protein